MSNNCRNCGAPHKDGRCKYCGTDDNKVTKEPKPSKLFINPKILVMALYVLCPMAFIVIKHRKK